MQPYKLILYGLMLASPMLANVTWSNPGTAVNSIPANTGTGRICRVQSGSNYYVGVATDGICTYVDGNTTTSSTNFLVAAGLGKWEAPNLPNPVEVGNLNFAPTQVCRPTLHTQQLATGYTLGSPARCYLPTSAGAVITTNFEVLYPFDTSGPMHVLQHGLCLSTRSGIPNVPVFQACNNQITDQWRLVSATGGFRLESVATPGTCVAQGNIVSFPIPIEGGRLVACASAPVLNLENFGIRTYRVRDTAANLVFSRRSDGRSTGSPSTFRAATGSPAELFEFFTLNEASRRLTAVSYNAYLLADDQFPALKQDDRAEWIGDAMDREGLLADVVAFQEGFQNSARIKLLAKLIGKGYLYFTGVPDWPQIIYDTEWLSPLTHITFGQFRIYTNGGVFVASRWPIERINYTRFVNASTSPDIFGVGADRFAAKGVTYARINKLGRRYHIFNTHLQAGSSESAVRRAQLQEMRIFADVMLAGQSPEDGVIFAGDFNVEMETEVSDYNNMLDRLSARFFDQTRPAGPSTSANNPRWTVEPARNAIKTFTDGSNQWLDYLLTSTRHAPVDFARYEVWQLKHTEDFDMKTAVLGFGSTLRARDLSDHGLVFARYRFAPTSNLVEPVLTTRVAFQTEASGVIPNGAIRVNGGSINTPSVFETERNVPLEIEAFNFLPGGPGRRFRFDRFDNRGTSPTFTYTPTLEDDKIRAEYIEEFELQALASPAGAGTVTGGGFYPSNTSVNVEATPASGFRFVRFNEDGRQMQTNPLRVQARTRPITVTAEFESTGAPRLSATTFGARTDTPNGMRRVFFKVHNSGAGGATNARIASLVSATVLSGSGVVSLPQGAIANFGAIPVNATSAEASLDFVWPTSATRVRLVLLIEADGGYQTTATLTLFR